MEDVEPRGIPNMVSYLQIVWLSSIFYNACLGFIKVSVLALYKRLGDRMLSRLSMVMIGVICCQAGANVLACIFQCSPVQAAYDITIPPEKQSCVDINAFYLANAAVNIFTDILTYTLPIPLVLKLQMPRRQKAGLAVILCLGLLYVSPGCHLNREATTDSAPVLASRLLSALRTSRRCCPRPIRHGSSPVLCTGPSSKSTSVFSPLRFPPSRSSLRAMLLVSWGALSTNHEASNLGSI